MTAGPASRTYRALLAIADGAVALARRLPSGRAAVQDGPVSDGGPIADGAEPGGGEAGRRREGARAVALRELVSAVLGRELREGESSVELALQLGGALRRGLDRSRPPGSVESLREAALRQLVEAIGHRPLEPHETAVGRALELVELHRRCDGQIDLIRARIRAQQETGHAR